MLFWVPLTWDLTLTEFVSPKKRKQSHKGNNMRVKLNFRVNCRSFSMLLSSSVGWHIHTRRPLPIIFSLLSVCLILNIKTGVQSTQFDWTTISSEWETDEGPFGWWSPDTLCSWRSLLLWCMVKLSQESKLCLVGIQNDRSLRWRAPVFYGWTMTAQLKTDMWHWQKGKEDVVYV